MNLHGELFEGPMPPQTRTSPPWPGRPVVAFIPAQRRTSLWIRVLARLG